MAAIPPHREEIVYPTSDGQPMAETTLHRKVMTDLIQGLERRFREVPDIWVGGNLFLYFEKGRPQAVVAPDVLLVKGVRKWDRPLYKLWEEGREPSLVIEVTSDQTRDEDLTKKKEIYQRLGVEEYFLFDPYGDYLDPRLQGHRLEGGRYAPMTPEPDGTLASSTTGLILRPEGERLRLVDPVTGPILREEELAEQLRRWAAARQQRGIELARLRAEEQARQEAAARQAAEERSKALEDELARLRAELGRDRGSIPEVDQDDMTFELKLIDGRKISAPMTAQHLETILEASKAYKSGARVLLQGIGRLNRNERLVGFESIEHVSMLDPLDVPARLDELRLLKDGWIEGRGSAPTPAGIDWLSEEFTRSFPEDLTLPFVYPTPEGGIRLEWSLGAHDVSLDIDLEKHAASLHALNLESDEEATATLRLDEPAEWGRLIELIRKMAGTSA